MRNLILLLISTSFFISCAKDPFEDIILNNIYDKNSKEAAINIYGINITKVDVHPITGDTSLIKYEIDYTLSNEYFPTNDIRKSNWKVTTELYVNEIEYPISFDAVTKKLYVYKGYNLFKNKDNIMVFKFLLYKDLKDPERRKLCSNSFKFRVN